MGGRPPVVKGRAAFEALSRTRRRARSGPVTVHFVAAAPEDGDVRVAYAVGRKVGGAVVRNRWRRRLRAVAAELSSELRPGTYLIGLGPEVRQLVFNELRELVGETMRKASGEAK